MATKKSNNGLKTPKVGVGAKKRALPLPKVGATRKSPSLPAKGGKSR